MINALIDFLFPPTCHCCGEKLVEGERFVCTSCLVDLPQTGYHLYWNNHSHPNADLNPMESRFAGVVPFVHATSAFFYNKESHLAELIKDFKYHKFPSLARYMGVIASDELVATGFFSGLDFIFPVPLHWRKRMKRGYNQSEMIGRGISIRLNIPLCRDLVAVKGHRTQTLLSREQRQKNTKDIFKLKNPDRYSGKHILIVDDICTTGSTMLSAAQAVLKACPDAKISFFSLGVTY